jgi:PKD repeat protein
VAINVMGSFNNERIIPVGIKISSAGTYQLSVTDMSSFSATAGLYLEDSQTGQFYNLRAQNTISLPFTAGEHNGRFFLRFVPGYDLNVQQDICNETPSSVSISGPSVAGNTLTVEDQNGQIVESNQTFNGVWNIQGLNTGNYRLNVSFPDGYTAFEYFTIQPDHAFTFTPLVSNQNPASGELISFSASENGITHIDWDFGDGTQASGLNVNHEYSNSGQYIVTATANNGVCEKTASAMLEVNNPLGLMIQNQNEWTLQNQSGQVVINGGNTAGTAILIEVFDASGRLIQQTIKAHHSGQSLVDLQISGKGIFMVRASTSEKSRTIKVSR